MGRNQGCRVTAGKTEANGAGGGSRLKLPRLHRLPRLVRARRIRTMRLERLNRPQYVFQPRATMKRLRYGRRLLKAEDVVLPWGQRISITPDLLGRSIALTRV